jgi:hypothetical protein
MKKNKKLIITLSGLVALALGLLVLNASMKDAAMDADDKTVSVTLSGIVVCLPHKESGPHTKECAIGLMTPDRKHYALDLSRVTMMEGGLQVSDRMTANGVVLASDENEKYDVVGTFSIQDSLVIE